MPPRNVHNLIDLLLGIARYYGEFDYVHRLLDNPWAKIFGKQHRRILHDERAVELITAMFGIRAGMAAFWHIYFDKLFMKIRQKNTNR